ncbi:UNVERIFIED_CONTAM: hypothetical protein FKN15_072309 [Acipenser sinensis]
MKTCCLLLLLITLEAPFVHTSCLFSCQVSIQDIEEVRPGRQSEGLQKNARDIPDSCCFSIFFKDQRKNLDLVASSEEEAVQWVTGLKKVIRLSDNLNSKQKQEHCLRKADTNSDSKMTFKELKHFLGEINIKVDDLYAEKLFNECDRSHSKTLEGSEIEEFYKRLTYRNEIEVIYSKYASSKGKMSVEDLGNFLRMEQREDVGLNEAKYELDEAGERERELGSALRLIPCELIQKYELDEAGERERELGSALRLIPCELIQKYELDEAGERERELGSALRLIPCELIQKYELDEAGERERELGSALRLIPCELIQKYELDEAGERERELGSALRLIPCELIQKYELDEAGERERELGSALRLIPCELIQKYELDEAGERERELGSALRLIPCELIQKYELDEAGERERELGSALRLIPCELIQKYELDEAGERERELGSALRLIPCELIQKYELDEAGERERELGSALRLIPCELIQKYELDEAGERERELGSALRLIPCELIQKYELDEAGERERELGSALRLIPCELIQKYELDEAGERERELGSALRLIPCELIQKYELDEAGERERELGSALRLIPCELIQKYELDEAGERERELGSALRLIPCELIQKYELDEAGERERELGSALRLIPCELIQKYELDEAGERERELGSALRLIPCELIQKYELDEAAKEKKLMSRDGFLMYLQSSDGLVLNPTHTLVYQDMSQPLNHYFISSSHNTYLMEDQLKGPSSTEAYVRAFTKGCRCVELDCWDGPNGDPVIYHGYTLTSKILFKDVIRTVKEYAFKNSEYPVVLSLETHCSMDQQKVMAHHMKTILGSMLLTAPLDGKMPTHFPSPEQLKGKILVKGKKLQSREHSMMSPESLQGEEEEESVSEEDEAADLPEEKGKPKKSKLKLARELSDLVVFCKSVHFPGFETARETQAFYEMSSFGESKAFKLAQESGWHGTEFGTGRAQQVLKVSIRQEVLRKEKKP